MSWERVKLGEISKISAGGDKPKVFSETRTDKCFVPIYSNGIEQEGLYGYTDKAKIKGDTITISARGNVGTVFYRKDDYVPIVRLLSVVPNNDIVDSRYLYYLLKDKSFLSTGAAQQQITVPNISNYDIRYENDLLMQKRIASILSAYDDLIEVNSKQIKLLEEAAERLYREWFIELRFPGHEQAAFNQDGLPNGWKKEKLGNVIEKLESGSRPKGGIDASIEEGVASVGAENVIGLGQYNYASDKLVSHDFYAKAKRGKIGNKDILIYKDGAYIGRTSLFQDDFPHKEAMVNEHVFLLHATEEKHQYFLFFTLHQQIYFEKMQKLNKNAAQPGINQEAIKSLELILPNDELLMQYDNLVSPLVTKIFALANQNREAAEARDLLLPRLMNGEIQL